MQASFVNFKKGLTFKADRGMFRESCKIVCRTRTAHFVDRQGAQGHRPKRGVLHGVVVNQLQHCRLGSEVTEILHYRSSSGLADCLPSL